MHPISRVPPRLSPPRGSQTHPLRKRKPWAQTSRFPWESTFSRFPYRASNTSPLCHTPHQRVGVLPTPPHPVPCVSPKTRQHSPCGEGGVVLVGKDLMGVPDGDKVLQKQGEGQLLVVRGLVHCRGTGRVAWAWAWAGGGSRLPPPPPPKTHWPRCSPCRSRST